MRFLFVCLTVGFCMAHAEAKAESIEPSTLTCSEFISLVEDTDESNNRAAILRKMDLTRVGYWVVGFMNGYIIASGDNEIVRLQDKGAGGTVMEFCYETPNASLSSVVAKAAGRFVEDR